MRLPLFNPHSANPPSPRRRAGVRLLLPALLLGVVTLTSCGTETSDPAGVTNDTPTTAAGSVSVTDPWVRATSDTEQPAMTAAFMALDNDGEEEIAIVGASSPLTGMVELHEMAMVDGESVMQEIEGGIVLAPARGQLLQPGGMHIMLMGLTEELAPGDEVELVLELSDGSTVEVNAPVKAFTEETEHYHAPGTSEEHEHQ